MEKIYNISLWVLAFLIIVTYSMFFIGCIYTIPNESLYVDIYEVFSIIFGIYSILWLVFLLYYIFIYVKIFK